MLPFVIKDGDVKQPMYIANLFPIPVAESQICEALNNKILAFMNSKEIKFVKNIGGNGTSVDEHFLDNDELSDVKQALTDSVNEYFKKVVNPNKDTKLYITISWLNETQNGESHHTHHHPNSIVSGIFYIDTCEEDTISFLNPKTDMFGHFNFSKHSNIPGEWTYPATTGRLIVFPSTLKHHVNPRPNTCKGTRLSLSFNTWIEGTIGSQGPGDPTLSRISCGGEKNILHLN